MTRTAMVVAAVVGLVLAAPAPADAQGPGKPPAEKEKEKGPKARGQAQGPERAGPPGQGRGQGQERARGQGQGQGSPAGPPAHARAKRGGPAPDVDAFNRDLVRRAAAVRSRRHGGDRDVRVSANDRELRVLTSGGDLLFALDRDVVDRLGYWRVGVVAPWSAERREDRDGGIFDGLGDDDVEAGSPAFCRSGAGHPVWGREWCLDKGFGLGDRSGVWGRATDVDDVIFRRPDVDRDLDRGTLADVLGDIVFGRIALQSLVLGADEPLTGRWLGDRDGPRILRVSAGDLAVAELVDADRDDDIDVLLFNLGD